MGLLELAESRETLGVVGFVGSGCRFGALAVRVCLDGADFEAKVGPRGVALP